ncbi:hypothetical protein M0R45_025895 [Rubus argutus]|uniref:Uncharacterized protein n=1 Tax=Rubus argutus TaxID=59490 RepID=A0AAW1WVD4_RUBAR
MNIAWQPVAGSDSSSAGQGSSGEEQAWGSSAALGRHGTVRQGGATWLGLGSSRRSGLVGLGEEARLGHGSRQNWVLRCGGGGMVPAAL